MRIRAISLLTGPAIHAHPGEVRDLDAPFALALIAAGAALALDPAPPPALAEPPSDPQEAPGEEPDEEEAETADAPPTGQVAVLRARRKRGA